MRNPLNRPNLELPEQFPIHVENLSVVADETTLALSGINLTINPGEFVGISGLNGSGKSTFESTILGLGGGVLQVVEGTVRYGDLDIYGKNMREQERTSLRARHFGYVPKEATLAPDLTAAQNILRPHNLMGRKIDRNHLHEVAERFDVASKLDTRVKDLSSGFRQRVNVVRGLVHNPQIAVLDEPTGALDPTQKDKLTQELRNYANEAGNTVIVVSHEETGADRLITLSAGRVVSDKLQHEGAAA